MPINAHPDYLNAEREFHESKDDDKLKALEKMIRFMPKHKSAEALRKNLRNRYRKLRNELEKKSKKSRTYKGIKKMDMQAVLLGLTSSGKSSLLKALTNANPKISSYGFTTNEPVVGILNFHGSNIQIIDLPPIASEGFNKGLINEADTIIIVVEKIHEIDPILEIVREDKEKIIVFNKIDLHDNETTRKISETLKSKKYNFVLTSVFNNEGLEELKQKIFDSFNKIRVYTKNPGKKQDDVPVIMPRDSSLRDVAEKILHGYSKKIKYAKIWGPSSKFKGQQVGLRHIVKDKDVVEFVTE